MKLLKVLIILIGLIVFFGWMPFCMLAFPNPQMDEDEIQVCWLAYIMLSFLLGGILIVESIEYLGLDKLKIWDKKLW